MPTGQQGRNKKLSHLALYEKGHAGPGSDSELVPLFGRTNGGSKIFRWSLHTALESLGGRNGWVTRGLRKKVLAMKTQLLDEAPTTHQQPESFPSPCSGRVGERRLLFISKCCSDRCILIFKIIILKL